MFTRLAVEQILLLQLGSLLSEAGYPTDADGANEAFDEPLTRALADFGVSVADRRNVTTAEVEQVAAANQTAFLDAVKLYLLRQMQTALGPQLVEMRADGRSEKYANLRDEIEEMIRGAEARGQNNSSTGGTQTGGSGVATMRVIF